MASILSRTAAAGLCILAACRAAPEAPAEAPPSAAPVAEREAATDAAAAAVSEVAATPAAQATEPAGPAPAQTPSAQDPLRERARQAIDAGDYGLARELVEQLVVGSRLAEARALLAQGRPEEALAVLEDVRKEAPGLEEAILPFAEASLATGQRLGETVMIESALAAFAQLSRNPEAQFGASRAAAALQRPDEALRSARAGMRLLDESGAELDSTPSPEATYVAAVLAAWRTARALGAPETPALWAEVQDAFGRALGANAAEPWVWLDIGDAFLEEGRPLEALKAFRRGLDRAPHDAALCDGLAQAAYRVGGNAELRTAIADFVAQHGESGRAAWYLAKARIDLALEKPAETTLEEWRACEKELARASELDPALAPDLRWWTVVCRDGGGWALYRQGDLTAARVAFESMEELVPGGLAWQLEGKLGSGVQGLELVAARFQEKQDLAAAAAIFDRLRAYQPENVAFANNAGFFNRDVASQLELSSEAFARAGRGEALEGARLAELRKEARIDARLAGTSAEREAFARAAADYAERARKCYEASFAAYDAAARLAPDDVRVQNDTALILVYHLHREWERAEELLMRAVEAGKTQLENNELTKDQRWELENAWGDAHENLGVLWLEHKQDPAAARRWFQRAIEIGPDPRPRVVEYWLARCDAAQAPKRN